MGTYFKKIINAFSELFSGSDNIRLKDIRLSRIVYFFAYALELMLFNARSLFLPIGADFGSVSGWTVAQIFHGIASLVFMLLWKERFRGLVKVAVAIMIIGFVPFVFLPYGYARLIFGIIFYIGLGGAVTSARCGYAFALNNAERLIGMIVMFFTVTVFKLINSLGADGTIVTYIIPFTLLILLSVCLLRFKPEDFQVKEKSDKADEKGIYWALAFFILYFSVDGYRASTVSSGASEYFYMCIGMFIAGIILFVLLAVFRLGTWHLWNLFFVFCVVFALFAGFTSTSGSTKPLYFSGGLIFIGWPLCIYTLGCAQRHFSSYALLKKCTVIFIIASPLTTISSDLLYILFPESFHIITMIYVIAAVTVFLMLSPYSHKNLFSCVWIKEINKIDMSLLKEKINSVDRFDGYSLTPRQKEIAILLLSAKTRRQIAGELEISESTVKMHVSDLYRKLNINSKAELFRIFGVEPVSDK